MRRIIALELLVLYCFMGKENQAWEGPGDLLLFIGVLMVCCLNRDHTMVKELNTCWKLYRLCLANFIVCGDIMRERRICSTESRRQRFAVRIDHGSVSGSGTEVLGRMHLPPSSLNR